MATDDDDIDGSTFTYYGGRPNISGEGITHIDIDPTVSSIESMAFFEWVELRTVYIPNSVRNIGIKAFRGCKSLTFIHLPPSIETIEYGAFYDCQSLSSIDLPDSITYIGAYCFGYCSSLTTIALPSSITTIEPFTFKWCSSISRIIIPPSVKHICRNAFRFCKSLTSIRLPNGLEQIDGWAFAGCLSLASIHIPPSTSTIGTSCFWHCVALEIIYIPSATVTSRDAFSRCSDNMIILTDDDRTFECDDYPSFTLQTIQQYIHDLPNNLQPRQQVVALDQVIQQVKRLSEQTHIASHRYRITNFVYRFVSPILQIIGQVLAFMLTYILVTDDAMPETSINLLHLLIYYPTDTYQPLSDLLVKCPQALEACDQRGLTPMDHVIASTKHVMDMKTYDLLMEHSSPQVVHRAIDSGSSWDEVKEILDVKIDALSMQDEKSGLLPFMMAAQSRELDVSSVYSLLRLHPAVIKMYT